MLPDPHIAILLCFHGHGFTVAYIVLYVHGTLLCLNKFRNFHFTPYIWFDLISGTFSLILELFHRLLDHLSYSLTPVVLGGRGILLIFTHINVSYR